MATRTSDTDELVAVRRKRDDMEAALRPLLARLEELSTLGQDWDSYGGLPPTPRAVDATRHLMQEAVDRTGSVPAAVLPFPNGGLQAIWERGDGELQVDVGPDGTLGYLSIRRGDGPAGMVEDEGVPLVEILRLVDLVGR